MRHLPAALAGGGWLVAIVVGVLSFGGGAVVENQTEVVDEVIASSPLADNPCPDGWESDSDSDRDAVVKACTKDGWRVILSTDGSFNIAGRDDAPIFETDPAKVPGWPQ